MTMGVGVWGVWGVGVLGCGGVGVWGCSGGWFPLAFEHSKVCTMITIVYGSILWPSSNNWASYRRLKWQIPALFL
jgi:hypothetical protein